MLDGLYASRNGADKLYGLLSVLEETLELAGQCVLVYAMLRVVAGTDLTLRLAR